MESPSFLSPRPKTTNHTEHNIEKGIEINLKEAGKWSAQETYTAWRNTTMSTSTMAKQTVKTKVCTYMYIYMYVKFFILNIPFR